MNRKKILEILKKLVFLPSISSNETVVTEYIKTKIKNKSIKYSTDIKGNLICQTGKDPKMLALVVHMDKVGFLVIKTNKKYLDVVGIHHLLKFKRGKLGKVIIITKSGEVYDGTLFNRSKKTNKLIVKTKQTQKISIGDFVLYKSTFTAKKDQVNSAYLDNSMGVTIAVLLLEEIKNGTIIFSVQEEMGAQGIAPAIRKVKPEKVIVLDTTYDIENPRGARLYCGKGPSICFKDKVFADKKVFSELLNIVEQNKIPHQIELWEEALSDIVSIHDLNEGVKSCFVGLPIKNPHSQNQIGSISDMLWAYKLIKSYFEFIYEY